MIVRELKENPDEVLANFDWFNDYKDTRSWAAFSFPEILERLDTGFETYRKEATSRYHVICPGS